MADTSEIAGNGEWVKVKEIKSVEQIVADTLPALPKTIQIVLLRNKKVYITGSYTKKQYFFDGAGATLDVDMPDVPDMLSKVGGTSCCSGASHIPMFAVV